MLWQLCSLQLSLWLSLLLEQQSVLELLQLAFLSTLFLYIQRIGLETNKEITMSEVLLLLPFYFCLVRKYHLSLISPSLFFGVVTLAVQIIVNINNLFWMPVTLTDMMLLLLLAAAAVVAAAAGCCCCCCCYCCCLSEGQFTCIICVSPRDYFFFPFVTQMAFFHFNHWSII